MPQILRDLIPLLLLLSAARSFCSSAAAEQRAQNAKNSPSLRPSSAFFHVIPAQAGIQDTHNSRGPRLRVPEGKKQALPNMMYFPTPALLATNHLWLAPPRAMNVSLGFEARSKWQAPISGLAGSLYRIAVLRGDFGVSANVVLQIRGALLQMLDIDESASRPMSGMPTAGTAKDVGDFSIATIARFWENRSKDFALGARIETRLPNTTQRKGIGTNTTDIFLSVLASKSWQQAMIFGDLGMGILTAPLETNVQNDVLLYGLGTVLNLREHWQWCAEINGYLVTRNIIPAGTEARGAARLGMTRQLGQWSVESSIQYGLTRNEGTWGASVAIARRISW